MSRFREILEELQLVLAGRNNILDSIIPPVIFVILNAMLGFESALWGSLLVAVGIAAIRLSRRQEVRYALGGVAGVVLAVLIARLSGSAEGYFAPGLISGLGTVLVCVGSAVVGRPMVAWTSHLARGWPLAWYWHPQVRPAYSEVTWAWAVFFTARLALEYLLFDSRQTTLLGIVTFITGWPAMIVLLILSYLYGLWRLARLQGPSVEEFKAGTPPPWQGQRRGF